MDAPTFISSIRHENDSIIDQMLSFIRRQPRSIQVRLFATYVECHLHSEMRHLATMLRGHETGQADLIERMYREIRMAHGEVQHFTAVWGESEPASWSRAFTADLKRLVCTFDRKAALEEDQLFPLLDGGVPAHRPMALAG